MKISEPNLIPKNYLNSLTGFLGHYGNLFSRPSP